MIDTWLKNIPVELSGLRQWVVWKLIQKPGKPKPDKIPFDPHTGRAGDSTDPAKWGMLEDAINRFQRGGFSGIGFVFANGYCGFDADECVNPDTGGIEKWAIEKVLQLDSYAEISPSGTGLHVLCKATLPTDGIRRNLSGRKAEIYCAGRFFTFTGNHIIGAPATVNERQAQALAVYNWIEEEDRKQKEAKQKANGNGAKTSHHAVNVHLSDSELMERALNAANGAKFERLWGGDIGDYSSASEADFAFCCLLAYRTKDAAQIERLWKASKLYRDKLERGDYLSRTIGNALKYQEKNSSADYKSVASSKSELTSREQIICRCFAFWNVSDEAFRAYIAVRGIANRRKVFKLSGALLGRHIRVKENGEKETAERAYENDKRCGNRRMNGLLKELKAKVNHPLLKIKTKGGKVLPSGKREAARYVIDESIFDLAENYAAKHPAMVSCSPDYNPGRAREEAALFVARKYGANNEPEEKPKKPEPDYFQIWIKSEKTIWCEAQKIADAWEELGKTTGERMDFADRMASHLKDVLLLKIPKNFRRKRKENQQVAESEIKKVGTHVSRVKSQPQPIDIGAVVETPVITMGDTQKNASVAYRQQMKVCQIEQRKDEIRRQFAGIMPANGRLFVESEHSEEVMRLAEELDELDRRLARLRECGSAIPANELVHDTGPPLEELLDEMDEFLASEIAGSNAARGEFV